MKDHNVDFIISPNGFGEKPPKIEDILNQKDDIKKSPVFEYKSDYFTVIANCLGVPALTIPLFESEASKSTYSNFPGSIRLTGFFGEDYHMLRQAQKIEKIFESKGMGM